VEVKQIQLPESIKELTVRMNPAASKKAWVGRRLTIHFRKIRKGPTLSGKDLVKWKYQRYIAGTYLAVIRAVDERWKVLDYLKEKAWKKTPSVYTSDQGFYLGGMAGLTSDYVRRESFLLHVLMFGQESFPRQHFRCLVSNLDFAQLS